MKKIVGLFPGQGSQKVGMGKDLYEKNEIAKDLFNKADKVLGFSLSQICFEGPEAELMKTEITQPAILVASTICYRIALEKMGSQLLQAAAGHSLGEYSALVAAEAIAFEDAVALVNKRGRYMQSAVPVGYGKMIAVLGMEVPAIEEHLKDIKGTAEIANINAPGQVVLSGDAEGIQSFLDNAGKIKTVELAVSAPFHCSLMKPAADKLKEDLKDIKINTPKFPVYSNYFAKPLTDPEKIKEALELQVCGRVRWVECMQDAITTYQPELFAEFSSNVLSGMLKRINGSVARVSINSEEDVEGLK